MTNYERIKKMSAEEIANKFERISNYVCDCYYDCKMCPFHLIGKWSCNKSGFVGWLNSEVEE